MSTAFKVGRYGMFGGQYVPETLMHALIELEREYERCLEDGEFWSEYHYYLQEYSGRPTPLYFAANLTKALGGGKIYLKRGGSEPHRCPQDQQCDWSGAAG